MVRKRSCPAVSQICSLTHLPSISTFLILKSILRCTARGGSQAVRAAGQCASPPAPVCAALPPPPTPTPRRTASPDGCDEARGEAVLRKAEQQAALAHACRGGASSSGSFSGPGHLPAPSPPAAPAAVLTAVPDEQQLYEVVIVLPLRHSVAQAFLIDDSSAARSWTRLGLAGECRGSRGAGKALGASNALVFDWRVRTVGRSVARLDSVIGGNAGKQCKERVKS